MTTFSFTRADRFLDAQDFKAMRSGQAHFSTINFRFIFKSSANDRTRLGMVFSRKFGNAVERNRMKRLTREHFRVNRGNLGTIDLLVIPRASCKKQTLPAIECAFREDFQAFLSYRSKVLHKENK